MLSNRLILIFLGVIFLIIIVLSSKKLSSGVQGKLAGFFPSVKTVPTVGPETDITITPTLTATPTIAHFTAAKKSMAKSPSQTPDTGAGTLSLAIIALLGGTGLTIKRLSSRKISIN